MKQLFPLIAAIGFLSVCVTLRAADGSTASFLDAPIKDIQLNTITAYAVIRVIGQAYAALRAGGGLQGIWNALMFGENAPRAILADYGHELGLNPKAVAEQKVKNEEKVAEAQKSPPS